MRLLDIKTFPLQGNALIEASAGTGKTYTIVNLYLRLLLGIGGAPLSVEQILVVTFTNAATAELRERIRTKLYQAYLDVYRGHSDDDFVQWLMAQTDDPQRLQQRLLLATRQMDKASIYTIHGFCQRVLTEHAFESGSTYQQTLVLDERPWLAEAVEDYWRREIVTLPTMVLAQVSERWASPEALLGWLQPLLYRQARTLQHADKQTAIAAAMALEQRIGAVKQWWMSADMAQRLSQVKLAKNRALGKDGVLSALSEFMRSERTEPPLKEGWQGLHSSKIMASVAKADQSKLDDVDFSLLDALVEEWPVTMQTLRLAIAGDAHRQVLEGLKGHKAKRAVLAPDDLLSTLQEAIRGPQGRALIDGILSRYPAALIDEFQDTDPVQYAIFSTIYDQQRNAVQNHNLIMIGDPKQAIYSFRGADIFTYLKARGDVEEQHQFTLGTNWRSQQGVVEAINQLFQRGADPFAMQQRIPFQPVSAAKPLSPLRVDDNALDSVVFAALDVDDPQTPIPWEQASAVMARDCAQRANWILQNAHYDDGQSLTPGDVCVLVRDRNEADLIKSSLQQQGLQSVFLVRKSVFATSTAYSVYLLLRAMAEPADERLLKAALCSDMLMKTAAQLEALFSDDGAWQNLMDLAFVWHGIWLRHGVMAMLETIAQHFSLASVWMSQGDQGQRSLTDFRHLCELLQEQGQRKPNQLQLVHWLAECLEDPDHSAESQQLRLETDQHLIQIVTMHSAKGLEYPVVLLPFAARYRDRNGMLYHDDSDRLMVDYLEGPDARERHGKEALAEDVRLLYVALTRAKYYCEVGIWQPKSGNRKASMLAQTSLGHLLLSGADNGELQQPLHAIAQLEHVGVRAVGIADDTLPSDYSEPLAQGQAEVAQLPQPVSRGWQMTSYSGIARLGQDPLSHVRPGSDEGTERGTDRVMEDDINAHRQDLLSPFTFERGAQAGSFLHGVLEQWVFDQPDELPALIEQQRQWFGIDEKWQSTIEQWLFNVVAYPIRFGDRSLPLASLPRQHYRAEMAFHLPLDSVDGRVFNQLLQRHSDVPLPHYHLEHLNGMLKGFIDLTVQVDGQYFVIDYKSNHLGDTSQDYTTERLFAAMTDHDYHLQIIIYCLALHRWLGSWMADYDYEQHIGGARYLFLRGMTDADNGAGVYAHRPAKSLILALDRLFKGQSVGAETPQQGELSW
ncbi:exodeoxyribonuclease V subunit beta [Aestuariibacter halophilus]|uniref:RecBCD enzyme subunit RecB n=1 Tax=Fluctibacter halophilus TaxID=226011 RepID=A0ABS8G5T7_9ALTE|nr:exodeoxyribonuclease V subunit beta [Aestuariibacter halophilus]MCC2615863.1 exodeoxyribonuclease V subunit beta [Aestuariibacter halophilus]